MTDPFIRFRVDIEKCIQGIQFLAANKPGITQYYVCKIFFFADKKHLLDWGTPISGDKYVIGIKRVGSAFYVVSKNFGQ